MIGELHRKAPIWRVTLWSAVGLTVASWLPTGTPSSLPAPPPSPVPITTAPITPVPPAATPPAESITRLRAFSNEVQAARSETREGARCERIAASFAAVRPEDHPHAAGALANARDEGLSCRAQIGQSDARLAEMETRARTFASDPTPTAAMAAARARQALTPFDRSRVEMDRFADGDRSAETAAALLAQSDARLTDFNAAHSAWRGARSVGGVAERQLASATQTLTGFDRMRMSPAQAGALTEATDLLSDLASSDRRLDDLAAALAAAQADASAADRLLDANGAIRPADRARADAQQRVVIAGAAARSRNLALLKLTERSELFRANPTDPAAVALLLRLQPALTGIDQAALTPEQQAGLHDLERAAVRLRDSDRALSALDRALQSFDSNRSRATGGALLTALEEISDFDRRRQSAAQAAIMERAELAAAVVRAPSVPRVRWATEIAIFVASPSGDESAAIVSRVQRAVIEATFRLAPSRAAAGLVIEVQPPHLSPPQPFMIGNLERTAVTATLDARLVWGVDGVPVGIAMRRQARGNGMAEGDARRNAVLAVADRLAESVGDALR